MELALIDQEKLEKIEIAFKNGHSCHQVCHAYKVSFETANTILRQVSESTRQGVRDHKLMLRTISRQQLPPTIKFLRQVMDGEIEGVSVSDRLKAAVTIMNFTKFTLQNDVLTMLDERPITNESDELQKTIFDYDSSIDDEGAAVLEAKPRLLEN